MTPDPANEAEAAKGTQHMAVALDQLGYLICPRCTDALYLHHGGVEYFVRAKEDSPTVRVTRVDDRSFASEEVLSSKSGNPSDRRDGLRIHFYCEFCGNGLTLNLAQDKGQTHMFWIAELPAPGPE
jgi:hypothetical protein